MSSGHHNFHELRPRIIVMGVGGAGGNAVNNMIASGLEGVEFVAANTDAQALSMSGADVRFQLGANLTEGLGAGSNPEIGEGAAEEVLEEMRQLLDGAHMVFVACGMGGGTGTGAAPVVARVAKEMGVLTVAVVTKPFHFEGRRRMRIAEAGIEQLRQYVDTMIVIPNQNLFRLATEQTTFADSFRLADQVLNSGVSCVTDLIMKEGLINLDFADVKTVITEMGAAVMGTGYAQGENRALRAAEEAISNPLIDDISLVGAKGLLISISGGADMTLFEVDEVASRIRREVDTDANIIVGATFDDQLEGHLRVSLVASGLNHAHPKSMHEAADRMRMEQDQRDDAEALNETQNSGLNDRLRALEKSEAGQLRAPPPGRAVPSEERLHDTGPSGEMPAKGQVQIVNKPPRFMSDGLGAGQNFKDGAGRDLSPTSERGGDRAHLHGDGLNDDRSVERRGELPGDMQEGRHYQPGPPQAVQQPLRRMPRVDELPVTGQKQMRAYETKGEPHGVEAQKKKVGFFDRLTGRGREDAEPPSLPQGESLDDVKAKHEAYHAGTMRPDSAGLHPPPPSHEEQNKLAGAPYPADGGRNFREGPTPPDPMPRPAGEVGPLPEGGAERGGPLPQERPLAPRDRYPTYDVRHAKGHSTDFDEDDDMPVDIPPFLKKSQK